MPQDSIERALKVVLVVEFYNLMLFSCEQWRALSIKKWVITKNIHTLPQTAFGILRGKEGGFK